MILTVCSCFTAENVGRSVRNAVFGGPIRNLVLFIVFMNSASTRFRWELNLVYRDPAVRIVDLLIQRVIES